MICTKCNIDKSDDQFTIKARLTGKRHSECKDCKAAYQRSWYKKNKDRVISRVSSRKHSLIDLNRHFLNQYKSDHGCTNCNENDYRCLDFHHIDDSKEANVSRMLCNGICLDSILQEVEKCIVLCSNCHRKIHN